MRRHITTAIAVAGVVLGPGGAVAGAQPGVDTNPHAGGPPAAATHHLRDTDPRSPDARDAANVLVVAPGVIAKSTPVDVSKDGDGGGLGLDEAGLGAGGLAAIALLALGAS